MAKKVHHLIFEEEEDAVKLLCSWVSVQTSASLTRSLKKAKKKNYVSPRGQFDVSQVLHVYVSA